MSLPTKIIHHRCVVAPYITLPVASSKPDAISNCLSIAFFSSCGKSSNSGLFVVGGGVVEIHPDQIAIDLAVKTAEVLDIQVAGIDLLYTEDGYTVCEANTFPGFRGLESACKGLNVPRAIFTEMLEQLEREKSGGAALRCF